MMRNRWNGRNIVIFTVVLVGLLVLAAGCGPAQPSGVAEDAEDEASTDETDSGGGETEGSEATAGSERVSVSIQTNWFAEPEHGGYYAAKQQGFYEEAGLDVTILQGAPDVSPVQIVGSGSAQFGMAHNDEILMARNEGVPLVGLMADFQKSPQVLMFHPSQEITDFSDLNGHDVYIAPGAGYWDYIKRAYELDVNEFAYTGQLATFVENENAVSQGYVTSEPFELEEQGIAVDYLFINDSGYAWYGDVIFTTEQYLEENPDIVDAFVKASVKGWNYYRDNYEEVNPVIQEANPDRSMASLNYGAEAEEPLVFGGDAEEHGMGYMSEERWSMLQDQMLEIGLIDEPFALENVYTTEFLPGS